MKGVGLEGTVLEVVNLAETVNEPLGREGSSRKVTPGLKREGERGGGERGGGKERGKEERRGGGRAGGREGGKKRGKERGRERGRVREIYTSLSPAPSLSLRSFSLTPILSSSQHPHLHTHSCVHMHIHTYPHVHRHIHPQGRMQDFSEGVTSHLHHLFPCSGFPDGAKLG